MLCELDQIVCIRRPFDEHDIGPHLIERIFQAPRRARPVMTNAEEMNVRHGSFRVYSCSLQARYRSFQPSRSFTTVSRYSRHTIVSCTGSLITAPMSPDATSAARSEPSPKCPASAMPLLTTLIASAVDSVPLGDLSF